MKEFNVTFDHATLSFCCSGCDPCVCNATEKGLRAVIAGKIKSLNNLQRQQCLAAIKQAPQYRGEKAEEVADIDLAKMTLLINIGH